MPSTDSETLYRVSIKTPTSPEELAAFCELLDSKGYRVVTDLQSGNIEIRTGEHTDEKTEDPHADYKATAQ